MSSLRAVLRNLTVGELKILSREFGISTVGTKDQLINRLINPPDYIMIGGARYDQAKMIKKYGTQLEKAVEQRENLKTTSEELLKKFRDTDPTKAGQYTEWLVKGYLGNGIRLLEDLSSRAEPVLENYLQLSQNKILSKGEPGQPWSNEYDVNNYLGLTGGKVGKRQLLGLEDLITKYQHELDKLVKTKQEKAIRKELAHTGSKLIVDNSEAVVIEPTTEKAACYYGQGTKWCTGATRGMNMYIHYHTQGPLYIVIPKKPKHQKEKYQIHLATDQFKDDKDEDVNPLPLFIRFKLFDEPLFKEIFIDNPKAIIWRYRKDGPIYIIPKNPRHSGESYLINLEIANFEDEKNEWVDPHELFQRFDLFDEPLFKNILIGHPKAMILRLRENGPFFIIPKNPKYSGERFRLVTPGQVWIDDKGRIKNPLELNRRFNIFDEPSFKTGVKQILDNPKVNIWRYGEIMFIIPKEPSYSGEYYADKGMTLKQDSKFEHYYRFSPGHLWVDDKGHIVNTNQLLQKFNLSDESLFEKKVEIIVDNSEVLIWIEKDKDHMIVIPKEPEYPGEIYLFKPYTFWINDIAKSVLSDKLLARFRLLDEPYFTSNLDPQQIDLLKRKIRKINQDYGVNNIVEEIADQGVTEENRAILEFLFKMTGDSASAEYLDEELYEEDEGNGNGDSEDEE